MMRRLAYAAATLAAMLVAAPAAGQGMLPFMVEGRGGLAFPTGEFGDGLGLGYSLGANAIFNVTPMFGVYGGYTFITFDFDDDLFGDTDETFDVQGFDAGVLVNLPAAGLSPYLRGGVVFYEAGLADRELGFQGGAGLNYPLGPVISITPEVSYVQIPAEFGPNGSFVKVDFGLRARL